MRSIPALCEGLADLGCEVTVYTTNANGRGNFGKDVSGPQNVDGINVHYFNRDLQGNYFYSRGLAKACHETIECFEVVYIASNWGYPFLPASRASFRANIPYVISPRASFKEVTWRGKFIKKWTYHKLFERLWINRAQLIHYSTHLELNDSSWLNLLPAIAIIPNPLDLAEFDHLPPRGRMRLIHNIPDEAPVLIYLGRVEPAKGLELAVDALGHISAKYPQCVLVIAGPEEENHISFLRHRAYDLGIEARVVFTGLLNSMKRLEALVDSDVFIQPSYSENFGMAVLEAMACGLPVAISDQVGLADLVRQEEVGLVTSLDPDQISEAWITLLNDASLRHQMGSKAKQVVHQQFDPSKVASEMLEAFNGILAQRLS